MSLPQRGRTTGYDPDTDDRTPVHLERFQHGLNNINVFKASNGEEIHGFLWQSLRLHAYDTGTLEGTRIVNPPHKVAVDHAHKVCEPTWWVSPQSMNDCAHAAGHVRCG